MTEQHDMQQGSMVIQLTDSMAGQAEYDLAEFELRMQELFEVVLGAKSDAELTAIAAGIGVSAERIRSFIEGDFAVSSEAFVRYLSAAGFRVILNAVPKKSIASGGVSRAFTDFDAARMDVYRQRVVTQRGITEVEWNRFSNVQEPFTALEDPRHEVSLNAGERNVRQRSFVQSSDDIWEAEAEWVEDDVVFTH